MYERQHGNPRDEMRSLRYIEIDSPPYFVPWLVYQVATVVF